MQLTVPQAARLYRKHRSTVHRHIESGLLSCVLRGDGTRVIDMTELVRCYGEPKHMPPELQPNATQDQEPFQQAMLQALQAMHRELIALREEVTQLRQLPAPQEKSAGVTPSSSDDPHGLRAMARRAFEANQSSGDDDDISS